VDRVCPDHHLGSYRLLAGALQGRAGLGGPQVGRARGLTPSPFGAFFIYIPKPA